MSLPDHAALLRELRLLERRASRVGRDVIDRGRTGGDDHANALFDDHDRTAAAAERKSIVAPAERSPAAKRKVTSRWTDDGLPVHSFRSLLNRLPQ